VTTSAEIAIERHGGTVVARLSGEVDMTNASYVANELAASVTNDAAGLVIDLTGARYLDSAAIELLFDLARRLQHRRQELRLALPEGSPLTRLLELTEVGSVAPIYATVEAALAE
jgi:anti-anti-sigma factor